MKPSRSGVLTLYSSAAFLVALAAALAFGGVGLGRGPVALGLLVLTVLNFALWFWVERRVTYFRDRAAVLTPDALARHGLDDTVAVWRLWRLDSLRAVALDPEVVGDPRLADEAVFAVAAVRANRMGLIAIIALLAILVGMILYQTAALPPELRPSVL